MTRSLSSTTRPLLLSQPILIWSNKTFRLQCPIANNCTSTFSHVAGSALVTAHRSRTSSETTRCHLLLGILMRFTPDGIRTQTKTKEASNKQTKSMQPTTSFSTRMKLRGYRQMDGQLRPTSVWPPMTSHTIRLISLYLNGQQSSSSPSAPNCPRLIGHGDPTSTSRKRTGNAILKPATNTWLKLAKQ